LDLLTQAGLCHSGPSFAAEGPRTNSPNHKEKHAILSLYLDFKDAIIDKAMEGNNRDQENYYQAIARRLFQLRGAPFVISPRENETIKTWEKMRIPLRTILEGIEAAFAFCSPGMKKRLTLNSCNASVMQRFKQYGENRVGNNRHAAVTMPDEAKEIRIQKEIARFLNDIPDTAAFLAPLYKKASRWLQAGGTEEEKLEQWDHRADCLILRNISRNQKENIREEIKQEYGLTADMKLEKLVEIQAVKQFRETYRVPYLSPYYY
jgi:hypothetical protein